jgi:hypothetical protein
MIAITLLPVRAIGLAAKLIAVVEGITTGGRCFRRSAAACRIAARPSRRRLRLARYNLEKIDLDSAAAQPRFPSAVLNPIQFETFAFPHRDRGAS